jgi:beta-lactamase class A
LIRRSFLTALGSAAAFGWVGVSAQVVVASPLKTIPLSKVIEGRLRDLEGAARGRLGVHILDVATGDEFGYRADERFMMLSSFKLLASAFELHRVDAGKEGSHLE